MNQYFIVDENGSLRGNIEVLKELKLSKIEIPSEIDGVKVTRIADNAFCIEEDYEYYEDSNVLKDIITLIVCEGIEEIGENVFRGCSKLNEVILPNSIVLLGEGVFQECMSLKSIILPNSIYNIPSFAFSNCFELERIEFSNKLTGIGVCAFSGCYELKSFSLPKSLLSIYSSAFEDCENLEQIIMSKRTKIIYDDIDNKNEVFNSCDAKIEYY